MKRLTNLIEDLVCSAMLFLATLVMGVEHE